MRIQIIRLMVDFSFTIAINVARPLKNVTIAQYVMILIFVLNVIRIMAILTKWRDFLPSKKLVIFGNQILHPLQYKDPFRVWNMPLDVEMAIAILLVAKG